MPILKKALEQAHEYAKMVIKEGDTVIDATMGNGNDTLFLSKLVGDAGKVIAFDIQKVALERTQLKLAAEGAALNYELVLDGHQNMDRYVSDPVKLVIYNLGYLPKGDHSIGTRAETTIEAVQKSMRLLHQEGLIIIVIYHGGDSGFEERDALLAYLKTIDCKSYSVMRSDFINQVNCPPILIVIEYNR